MKDGEGQYFYLNGSRYIGEWKYNKRHGEGLLINANGCSYQGKNYI